MIVVRIVEVRLHRAEVHLGGEVGVERARVDDLAGIHLPLRVPQRPEVVEGTHQLGSVHPLEQLAPRLAVAVLAGERPPVGHRQVGGLLHEPAVPHPAVGGLEVEVDPEVETALAEVTVHTAVVAVPVHDRPEVGEVVAESLGGDGGVLPSRPHLAPLVHTGGGADPRLPDRPDPPDVVRLAEDPGRRLIRRPRDRRREALSAVTGFELRLAGKLDEEVPPTAGKLGGGRPGAPGQRCFDALETDGLELEHLGNPVGRLDDVAVAEDGEGVRGRGVDQGDPRPEDQSAGALGADEGPGDVGTALGKQFVEVVARHAAGEVGESVADGVGVLVAERAEPSIQSA